MDKNADAMDFVLAGRLADLIGVSADISVEGNTVILPIRAEGGGLTSFAFDVTGLASSLARNAENAVTAMGDVRGGQYAALALLASNLLEEHHEEWDPLRDDEAEEYEEDDLEYEPVTIDLESLGQRGCSCGSSSGED